MTDERSEGPQKHRFSWSLQSGDASSSGERDREEFMCKCDGCATKRSGDYQHLWAEYVQHISLKSCFFLKCSKLTVFLLQFGQGSSSGEHRPSQ